MHSPSTYAKYCFVLRIVTHVSLHDFTFFKLLASLLLSSLTSWPLPCCQQQKNRTVFPKIKGKGRQARCLKLVTDSLVLLWSHLFADIINEQESQRTLHIRAVYVIPVVSIGIQPRANSFATAKIWLTQSHLLGGPRRSHRGRCEASRGVTRPLPLSCGRCTSCESSDRMYSHRGRNALWWLATHSLHDRKAVATATTRKHVHLRVPPLLQLASNPLRASSAASHSLYEVGGDATNKPLSELWDSCKWAN